MKLWFWFVKSDILNLDHESETTEIVLLTFDAVYPDQWFIFFDSSLWGVESQQTLWAEKTDWLTIFVDEFEPLNQVFYLLGRLAKDLADRSI